MLNKKGIFPKDRTYRAFFVVFKKRKFFCDSPKALECIFLLLCMQLRLRINFLDLILAQKSVDQLSIANSYKHRAQIDFCYTIKVPPYRQNRRLSAQ